MYELKEESLEKLIKVYGEKILNKPFGEAVKNNISPYYVIYKDGKKISDFIVYTDENNWIAIDRKLIEAKELMTFLLEKLKNKYQYLTIYINKKDAIWLKLAEEEYDFKPIDEISQYKHTYVMMKKEF